MRLRLLFWLALTAGVYCAGASVARLETSLAGGWRSFAADEAAALEGFESTAFEDASWTEVTVPHNWDDYAGLSRVVHGNRHGYAAYRKTFLAPEVAPGGRTLLFFEGVGSRATVWVNGRFAGEYAGGRTTFTLDVTELVRTGEANLLAVRADHPAGITDLPWACGGCSTKAGYSEGSQPLGIFRPVTLITTGRARVAPFGVHVWNDADATATAATAHFSVEVLNHGGSRTLTVDTRILDADGAEIATLESNVRADRGTAFVPGAITFGKVRLWSPTSPHLYRMITEVRDGDEVTDRVETSFGIRTLKWSASGETYGGPLLVNGVPLFINGTCEYEHVLGGSHAFGPEQIAARVAQVKAAGFNAFRDAHQPHNLRYQEHLDREGILWWPQFVAQIWYDTPEFRENFKRLLRDWVRERRNNPSNFAWGLANESKLPTDFAKECADLIRELDPTASAQRLVTTCNSGTGVDWNVPQNWTGTYGGDPATYADDLLRQQLVGEYGAWRSLGLHSEGGYVPDGIRSESRADAIYAMKIRLAESVRERVAGHFHWLLATHENPGRTIGSKGQQGTDGWAEVDRIGPANNKGLLTLWGEPTDAYHLYRASYAPASSDPMVYIVSHTWADRWKAPGVKDGILVYSNCDEVELFNDAGARESLGIRKREGPGMPLRWDGVELRHNVLYAEGRVAGRTVARDAILLKNLPEAPNVRELRGQVENLTAPTPGWNYLYRVNCGGADYTDVNGNLWRAERDFVDGMNHGTLSWAMEFPSLHPRLGSQRESFEVVRGTDDQALFQTYRYGRHKLRHRFAVPDGNYRVELYFMEPWYGAGGGDCRAWRLFDVAVNGRTVLANLDLWSERGYAGAVKRVVEARVSGGWLEISYPRIASYQAVISAIAIASSDPAALVPAESVQSLQRSQRETASGRLSLGESTYGAADARREGRRLTWSIQLGLGGGHEFAIRHSNPGPEPLAATLSVVASDGTVMGTAPLELVLSPDAVAVAPEFSMNAGDYTVVLELPEKGAPEILNLIIR